LRHIEEKRRYSIIRIFVELILREPGNPTDNRIGANKGKRNSAKAFQDRMGTLQKYTDFENLVDAMFCKSGHENPFAWIGRLAPTDLLTAIIHIANELIRSSKETPGELTAAKALAVVLPKAV